MSGKNPPPERTTLPSDLPAGLCAQPSSLPHRSLPHAHDITKTASTNQHSPSLFLSSHIDGPDRLFLSDVEDCAPLHPCTVYSHINIEGHISHFYGSLDFVTRNFKPFNFLIIPDQYHDDLIVPCFQFFLMRFRFIFSSFFR